MDWCGDQCQCSSIWAECNRSRYFDQLLCCQLLIINGLCQLCLRLLLLLLFINNNFLIYFQLIAPKLVWLGFEYLRIGGGRSGQILPFLFCSQLVLVAICCCWLLLTGTMKQPNTHTQTHTGKYKFMGKLNREY